MSRREEIERERERRVNEQQEGRGKESVWHREQKIRWSQNNGRGEMRTGTQNKVENDKRLQKEG